MYEKVVFAASSLGACALRKARRESAAFPLSPPRNAPKRVRFCVVKTVDRKTRSAATEQPFNY